MYLSTRVCGQPNVINKNYSLSYDEEIWPSTRKISEVRQLYFDQYGFQLTDEHLGHLQPKNALSLNYFENNFYPCVLKITDYEDWIQTSHFYPNQAVYEEADLVSIGYDVMELGFISIASHGVSAQYRDDLDSLNQFNLLKSLLIAKHYLKINLEQIPEHPWKVVEIFINRGTYERFSHPL